RLFAGIDRVIESGQKTQRARDAGQHDLFGGLMAPASAGPELPDTPPWPESQVLAGEKEVLGFYLTGHPLRKYQSKLRDLGTIGSSNLANFGGQKDVAIGGIITSIKVSRSKKGDLWASAVLEDLEGTVDLLFFPEAYKNYGEGLKQEAIVFVKGMV